MKQKLIKIGNSTGVIIPKQLLKELGLKEGSEVAILRDAAINSLNIIKHGSKTSKSSIRPTILKSFEKIKKQYHTAFEELAKL